MSAAQSTEVVPTPAQENPEAGHKIFVGNLAYATTDEGLKTLFAGVVSDILSVQVIQRGTRSAGYGFVSVKEVSQVEKAVAELNKHELDGREIIVEAAKPAEDKAKEKSDKRSKKRTAGRRGNKAPPGEVTEAEANGEATGSAPEAADTEAKPKKRTKKPRKPRTKKAPATDGESSAAAAADGAAPAAVTETPADAAPKRQKRTRTPKAPRAEGEQPEGEPSKSVVFVANLAFNVDDAALAQLFKDADINVVSARVVRRRFGQPRRSKGYGFVDVGDEEQQKKALEAFAGKEFNGREIAVKIAVSAPNATGSADDATPAGALTEDALAKKDAAERPDATVLAH